MTWILAKIGQMNLISPTTVNRVRQQQVERNSENGSTVEEHVPVIEGCEPTGAPFQICLLVDSGAMISVYLPDRGVKEVS